MDLLAELERGWGLRNASRDAFAAAGGALGIRAPATEPAALVDAGRDLMRRGSRRLAAGLPCTRSARRSWQLLFE
jgi:hypothetical protein